MQERLDKLHQERLKSVKSAVDNSPPQHFSHIGAGNSKSKAQEAGAQTQTAPVGASGVVATAERGCARLRRVVALSVGF